MPTVQFRWLPAVDSGNEEEEGLGYVLIHVPDPRLRSHICCRNSEGFHTGFPEALYSPFIGRANDAPKGAYEAA